MTEYISKEQAIDTVAFYKDFYDPYPRVMESVANIPAADVVEVKHGVWKVSRTDYGWNSAEYPTHCKCTLCGREVPYFDKDNYCPNCGAKMDGGKNE